MMTSSNGNIFRVTGPLCGEFTGHCIRINASVNNRDAGDLRRHRAHYDVIVMVSMLCSQCGRLKVFPASMVISWGCTSINQLDIEDHKSSIHDSVIKWKHLPRYLPFVRGNHRSPVNSPHKGQWRGATTETLAIWDAIAPIMTSL